MNSFFAMMSRMKYIDRWALMRNSRNENLSEHSLEVSMIAHALAGLSIRGKLPSSASIMMPQRLLPVICPLRLNTTIPKLRILIRT